MKKSGKTLLFFSMIWATSLLVLGGWWSYLILTMSEKLNLQESEMVKISRMMKWEGGTFLLLFILLSITLMTIYLRDNQKSKALQSFFASLTHELKTPLASIRLQAEVINDLTDPKVNEKVFQLTERLIEDTQNLETQMDKILQLSRLERGGELPLQELKLSQFLREVTERWGKGLAVEINNFSNEGHTVLADNFALELVFRNLMENTVQHTKDKRALITVEEEEDLLSVLYKDGGQFTGNPQKIGSLFYKYNSPNGSGIGLYLCQRLVKLMKGRVEFRTKPEFVTSIKLVKGGRAL